MNSKANREIEDQILCPIVLTGNNDKVYVNWFYLALNYWHNSSKV